MQCSWLDFQNVGSIVFSRSSSLIGDKGQRIAFIHQAQLAFGVVFGAGIQINSALNEVAMKVGDQASDVAGFQPYTLHFSATVNEFLHGLWCFVQQGIIDGVNDGRFGKFHLGMRKKKFPNGRIHCESVYSGSCGVYQHGGRAVEDVARDDLFRSFLEEILIAERFAKRGNPAVNAEDGSDGDIDVNVGTAIQRVDHHHILSFRSFVMAEDVIVLFFRANARDRFAGGENAHEGLVGKNVQLLLVFVMGVLGARLSKDAGKARSIDLVIDNLGSDAYVSEQTGQLSGDKREFRLRVHDELLECDGFRHFPSPIIAVCERMYEIDLRLSCSFTKMGWRPLKWQSLWVPIAPPAGLKKPRPRLKYRALQTEERYGGSCAVD